MFYTSFYYHQFFIMSHFVYIGQRHENRLYIMSQFKQLPNDLAQIIN